MSKSAPMPGTPKNHKPIRTISHGKKLTTIAPKKGTSGSAIGPAAC